MGLISGGGIGFRGSGAWILVSFEGKMGRGGRGGMLVGVEGLWVMCVRVR